MQSRGKGVKSQFPYGFLLESWKQAVLVYILCSGRCTGEPGKRALPQLLCALICPRKSLSVLVPYKVNSPCSTAGTKAHSSSLCELIQFFLVKHKNVQSHDFKLDCDPLWKQVRQLTHHEKHSFFPPPSLISFYIYFNFMGGLDTNTPCVDSLCHGLNESFIFPFSTSSKLHKMLRKHYFNSVMTV